MKRPLFAAVGLTLVVVSLLLGYVQVGFALRGSAWAWILVSLLVCTGVLGAGMIGACYSKAPE